jgi:16S rRNA processing protein RimM
MTLAPEPWVWLARIRRPQGRKGEVFAELLTDFPQKFAERRRLWLLPENPSSSTRAGALGPGSPATGPSRWGGDPSHSGTRETALIGQQARQVDLINHWLHKGGIVLHFAGVDSISAAEALAGLIVAIPRAERAALPEDEAYIGDLIGCALVDVSGAEPVPVGEIVDVESTAGRPLGTAPLLIVQGPAGEVLIPFAKSYLRRIDVAAKRVEMALPDGLIDLNVPEEP